MKTAQTRRRLCDALLIFSLAFLGYAAFRFFSPPPNSEVQPIQAPPAFDDEQGGRNEYSLRRYDAVATGRMFLGEAVAPNEPRAAASRFVARATFPGDGALAVLAPAGEPPEGRSWVVREGDVVEGERVLHITHRAVIMLVNGQRIELPVEG